MSEILTAKIYQGQQSDTTIVQPSKYRANLVLSQFMELLENMLRMDRADIVFAPSYPKYLIEGSKEFEATMDNPTEEWVNTITYKVTRLEPGAVGGNKQPFDGETRETRPKYRQSVPIEGTNDAVQIYGQLYDTFVQFDIWTQTNTEAEELAVWFQDYMKDRRDLWKHLGLRDCLFWWRGMDDSLMSINKKLQTRSLTFWIAYEELEFKEAKKLQELEVQIRNKFFKEE